MMPNFYNEIFYHLLNSVQYKRIAILCLTIYIIFREKLFEIFGISLSFVATRSGLTRFNFFNIDK